ncbi:MAG: BamA/TamA family outer membrane protein [Bacteroidetes bacterium]|nr:BamA/TamA family outer membrane protein [Bacteroidota bacterium]
MKFVFRFARYYFFFILGLSFLGCNTTRHLEGDDSFLIRNEIEFVGNKKIRKKRQLREELTRLYKQEPNGTTLLFVPKEHFYYKLLDTAGTSNFNKRLKQWQMRQFGEEPAIFDRDKTERTAQAIEYYLQNKGYFEADVEYFIDYRGKRNQKIIVTYEVGPKTRYLIDSVTYRSADPKVHAHLQKLKIESLLAPGQPVDQTLYADEVNRITAYLRENGYAFFQPAFISELSGDSTGTTVDIELEVLLPEADSLHQTFTIGDIHVYPGFNPNLPMPTVVDTLEAGLYFWSQDSTYAVKPKTILDNLSLHRDSLFRQTDYDRTYRQLNNLGIFRLVTLQESRDPDNPNKLNFNIYLQPNDRFEFGADAEINTSNSPFIGRLFGVSGGISLRHRNLLKGAELFVADVEGGVDLNLSNFDSLINTVDFTTNGNLYLPKLMDPFRVYRGLNKIGIISDKFYDNLNERASSRIGVGYNFLQRFNLYVINSLNTSFGYDARFPNGTRYRVNHAKIDYFSPRTTNYFDTLILNKNPFLQRSFDKQLFTGLLIRDFDINFNRRPNQFGESFNIGLQLEGSGAEVALANWVHNKINNVQDTFSLRTNTDTIQFSQYLRSQVDVRYTKRFNSKQSFALRFYTGLAFPFAYGDNVPYVKQFFAGGAESIRAWSAREIGPGGYRDPLTVENNPNPLLFYQSGEFKIELNAEYRFYMMELFGLRFEGALFLDAGNIYTLSPDPNRPLSHLRWTPDYEIIDGATVKVGDNFLQYLAVGSGFGLRLDVTYFMIRFDIGMKLRNPYPTLMEDGTERYWRDLSNFKLRDLNFGNIGLGYPF